MTKLNSVEELMKVKESVLSNTEIRTTGESPDRTVINVGMATCGISAGARVTLSALIDAVAKNNLKNISVVSVGCIGPCKSEPIVEVKIPGKDPIKYMNVDEKRAVEIVEKHVMQGILLENAILGKEVGCGE